MTHEKGTHPHFHSHGVEGRHAHFHVHPKPKGRLARLFLLDKLGLNSSGRDLHPHSALARPA